MRLPRLSVYDRTSVVTATSLNLQLRERPQTTAVSHRSHRPERPSSVASSRAQTAEPNLPLDSILSQLQRET